MDKNLTVVVEALIERIRDFPKDAFNDLFLALDTIERKYDLIKRLSADEKCAIDQGVLSIEQGETFSMEEVLRKYRLDDYDEDAAGKENFLDVVSRVQNMSGGEQGQIADVILTLLNEYRHDILPPPLKSARG